MSRVASQATSSVVALDEDEMFALMDLAMLENEYSTKASVESETPSGVVCYLADGDVHVCRGHNCQFLELNEDGCYVCKHSGIVAGPKSVRTDFSTGRQAGSADPDAHAGEPVGGTWKPKKDGVGLSRIAFEAAGSIEEDAIYVSPEVKKNSSRPPVKRGARCVDEPVAPVAASPKRARPSRNADISRETFNRLCQEAEVTMRDLVNFDKKPVKEKARDPRLMNKDILFAAAIKRYLKECSSTGSLPTLDAVHNIAIAASNVAEEEKRKSAIEGGNVSLLLKVRMREQVTSLAVTLWNSSLETPYMQESRRGSDSFKPFICGVLYGLKRGVSLPDGSVVVPSCPQLAEALPALRATVGGSKAKALHASSHRGLCTLHRCINSCTENEASEIYANATRIATTLAKNVRNGRFDL